MSNEDHRTDGGIAKEDIFGTTESSERARISATDRFTRILDLYVLAPLRIAWSDWRARIGGIGVLFYLLMGTVGVAVVPKAKLNAAPRYTGAFEGGLSAIVNEGGWVDPGHVSLFGLQVPWIKLHMVLGTDNVGRSVAKQIIHSTPAMLQMALAGVVFAVGIAVIVGFIAGYKGGLIDEILMMLTDIMVTIPGLPLIIVLTTIYTPKNPFVVGAILAIDSWPGLARSLRSQVLTLREEDFVESARAMGLSTATIIRQELLPKLAPYILVSASGAATAVISASVSLYFLQILPFSTLNWGVMMQFAYTEGNALAAAGRAGHWLFFPALALSGLTFSLVLFSQGMDRVFNPRLRARHAKTTEDEEDESEHEGTGML
jgi:peptide/nickel transport system permease protein